MVLVILKDLIDDAMCRGYEVGLFKMVSFGFMAVLAVGEGKNWCKISSSRNKINV